MHEIKHRLSVIDPQFKTPDRDTPVSVWIGFYFSPLASAKPGEKAIPKTTRPDVDNMAKAVIDCLTKTRVLADDAQITNLSLSKFHNPRSEIDREAGYIAIHLIYHT
jgi:Holliday junction resolvase RusA-like endonuclease